MRRLARSALLLTAALALLAGACSPDETESADDSVPDDTAPLVTAPSTTVPPSTTAAAPEPVPLADIALDLELVAELPSPTAMTTAPGEDGTVLVSGREGVLYAVDLSGGGEPRPVLDFSDRVSTSGEQGFLGVATSPDGARVYVSYTDPAGATRIDEYGIDGTTVDEGSRREVFGLPQPFSNHNGGNIAFGPDELLYLGLGDGGAADDPDENGQDTTTLLGSMVRIDPTQQGSRSYGVPEDNPFTDDDGRTEIWAYGLRNPWRFSFDRVSGDLWIGDVGQNEIEEIDLLRSTDGEPAGRGANLGWNLMEGSEEFAGSEPPDHVGPVFDYAHEGGNCSVTGGYVYRGEAVPDLVGTYVFGDYCVSELRGLRVGGGAEAETAEFGVGTDQNTLVSFGEDAAGELYVLAGSGEIHRIVSG